MQKDTIIYVTDQRQKYLADMLNGEKESCHGDKIRDYARVGNIIFPTPFSRLRLSDDEMEKLKQNIIKHDIAVGTKDFFKCAHKYLLIRQINLYIVHTILLF